MMEVKQQTQPQQQDTLTTTSYAMPHSTQTTATQPVGRRRTPARQRKVPARFVGSELDVASAARDYVEDAHEATAMAVDDHSEPPTSRNKKRKRVTAATANEPTPSLSTNKRAKRAGNSVEEPAPAFDVAPPTVSTDEAATAPTFADAPAITTTITTETEHPIPTPAVAPAPTPLAQPAATEPEPMFNEVKQLVDELHLLQQQLKALREQQEQQPDSDDTMRQGVKKKRRAMSKQQKQRLHVRICSLKGSNLQGLVDLVDREASEALVTNDNEVEIDLSVLPSAKLWMLDEYCKKCV